MDSLPLKDHPAPKPPSNPVISSPSISSSTICPAEPYPAAPGHIAPASSHSNASKFFTPATIRRFTGGHQTVPKEWMSATGLRPLLLGDPVLLWLEHYGAMHGFTKDPEEHSFLSWIGAKGQQFEAAVVSRWAPGAVQVLSEDWDVRDADAFVRTLQALDEGHEVLTKCALWGGDAFQVYGTADIIAKSNWVYKNWPHLRPDTPEPAHYCILDAKFMKGLDRECKKTELEMASSQVRMYSWILGHLQGFMPPRAFLLCRDGPVAVPVGHSLGSPLDPELAARRDRHLDIKLNGANYLPGRDAIVAPGFSNLHDEPWHGAKKRIAAEFIPGRPLHWLPRVGDRQAEALKQMGIDCLDDLLARETFPFEEISGLGPTACAQIRAVLQANSTGQSTPVPADAAPPRRRLEFYCDFEFLSNLNVRFDEAGGRDFGADPTDLTGLGGQEMVFQIGCGWEERGQWRFRCFTAAHEDVASERRMFEEFLSFLEEKGVFRSGQDAVLYHWSQAEVGQSSRAAERTGLARLTHLPWLDVQEGFHHGPVALPGMWNFGLKSVSRALGEPSPAHAVEYPADLADGLSAMVLGWEAFERTNPRGSDEMRLIEQYLEIDCKSLWQVVRWLRASADIPAEEWTAARAAAKEPCSPDFHWYSPRRVPVNQIQASVGAGEALSLPVKRVGFWWPGKTRPIP